MRYGDCWLLLLTIRSFFVNHHGQIRMVEAPDKEYVFHATNNERVNELRREAMQGMKCHGYRLSVPH